MVTDKTIGSDNVAAPGLQANVIAAGRENLLADSQGLPQAGQAPTQAPASDANTSASDKKVPVSDMNAPFSDTKAPVSDTKAQLGSSVGDLPPERQAELAHIKTMLDQTKLVKSNIVMPGEVVTVDDLNFNRDPAWIPHTLQKSPVDTIDDLIIDRQGNLIVNSNKTSGKSKDGSVSIGVESDQVHWSPLYLDADQLDTVRDTISYMREHNPQAKLPQQLNDMPLNCLASVGTARPSANGGPTTDGPATGQPAAGVADTNITAAAQKSSQDVNGTGQPPVDPALFDKLDTSKLTDRIVVAVASNEGNLTTVTTNDAGFGWSIGMRQWNQHVGELPALLGAMYTKDPCTFVRDFGPYAGKLINHAGDPAKATVNESFIRHADFTALLGSTGKKHMKVNHVEDVQKALNDFQDVQLALSREFVQRGIRLAGKYNFKSELGWAEVSDIVNQKGAGGAERVLRTIPKTGSEANRIKALETAANRPGGQARLKNLQHQFSANTPAKP